MPQRVERFLADQGSLQRLYNLDYSTTDIDRLDQFLSDTLLELDTVDFESLPHAEKVDWILFRNQLQFDLRMQELKRERLQSTAPWLPFIEPLEKALKARRNIEPIQPREVGDLFNSTTKKVEETTRLLKSKEEPAEASADGGIPLNQIDPETSNRAARWTRSLIRDLQEWNRFYDGYDPLMSWWTQDPFAKLVQALEAYEKELRNKAVPDGDPDKIIGDPIGREALIDSLKAEFIPYTPEELIEIAEKEFAWCEKEMERVSRELGFEGDWKATLEYVKDQHVQPGEQPALIRDLAQQSIDFLENLNLLTIPPLAKETWRMVMMTPERQRVSPYFTGGEVISVSFPTDTMDHESKAMSMRGNNIHFSRATVHHELIPGHHMQLFMADRYNTHRRYFRTPFLVEGWALYWEMLLWDLNFQLSPKDEVGMLFWRSHRCARIIFSLSYHLEKMSAEEAVEFVVSRVGHERSAAEAEVRRSVSGGYEPLYQAAYMLGGLQIRSMRKELVENGDWTDRQFHDAILKENAIPVSLIRASLKQDELTPETEFNWRFYEDLEEDSVKDPNTDNSDSEEQARVDSNFNDNVEVTVNANVNVNINSEVAFTEFSSGLKKKSGGSLTDYQRANSLRQTLRNTVFRDSIQEHWKSPSTFWYRVEDAPGKFEWYWVDAQDIERLLVFEAGQFQEAWKSAFPKSADRVEITDIQRIEGARFLIQAEDQYAEWNAETLTLSGVESKETSSSKNPDSNAENSDSNPGRRGRQRWTDDSLISPDGKFRAEVYGHNLRLIEVNGGQTAFETHDGNPDLSFRQDVSWQRQVNMRYNAEDIDPPRPEVFWSPDSQWIATIQTRAGVDREVTLVDSAPDQSLQPVTRTYPYLKPGDEIPTQILRLFHLKTGKEIRPDGNLISNPWRLNRFRWAPDSSEFYFQYNQRGHQVLRVLAVDVSTGSTRTVIDERSKTFVDYAYKNELRWLKGGDEALWMSERSGWNHLYRYDMKSGEVLNSVTEGEWVFRGIEFLDEDKGEIIFSASGVYPGQDPYYIHYGKVNLDGTSLTWLTDADGTHEVKWGPERAYLIDSYSRVDQAPRIELRQTATGRKLLELEVADTARLEATGWKSPERYEALGRDGETKIYGVIFRPMDFDPEVSYPVIEKIYAGPHGAFVPKSFRSFHSAQAMAELGFIVVQVDGMGTNHRSKAFHDVCWKNLGDSGFPDRRLWIEAAAADYPQMDLNRVGIFGGSAGGQSALRALLAHGDFYHAAVADCGCHDNRIDKIWWNELWMSWPVGPHYHEQSNVTQAHRLEGDLLLVVGELDQNVDPASTYQVVDALIQADKDFEMLMIPGAGHGAAETPYGSRKRQDFFVEKLMGVTPRWTH